jgi:osmotically-inducible protein OsmY
MITATTEHLVEHATEHLTQDLAARVEQSLWSQPRLRSTDSLFHVSATPEGAVTLAGHVRGDMLRILAGRCAAQVPGVTGVANQLASDTQVESDVAVALAMDPAVRTYTDHVGVKSVLGVVSLSGTIAAADMAAAEAARSAAERHARAVTGVRAVINTTRAVVGGGPAATGAAAAPAGGAESAKAATMQARLAVWRERRAAR